MKTPGMGLKMSEEQQTGGKNRPSDGDEERKQEKNTANFSAAWVEALVVIALVCGALLILSILIDIFCSLDNGATTLSHHRDPYMTLALLIALVTLIASVAAFIIRDQMVTAGRQLARVKEQAASIKWEMEKHREEARKFLEKAQTETEKYGEKLEKFKRLDLYQTEAILLLSQDVEGLQKLQKVSLPEDFDKRFEGIAHQLLMIITEKRDFTRLERFIGLPLQHRSLFSGDSFLFKVLEEMFSDPDCPTTLREKLKHILPRIRPK